MLRSFIYLLVIVSISILQKPCYAENTENSNQKNEQIQTKFRYIKYKKNKRDIKKQTFLLEKKQKELEYLENRLDVKKKKLESLTSNEEKGEEK